MFRAREFRQGPPVATKEIPLTPQKNGVPILDMRRTSVAALLFVVTFGLSLVVGFLFYSYGHDPVSVAVIGVIGFVFGLLLSASVQVVAEWERMIILRLGRYQRVADPGMRLLIPVLDTPLYVEMRLQTVNIERQQAITQDNVPVLVNGVIFFKVVDPMVAALKVQDYRTAIWRMAQATLRDVVGGLTLDDLLSQQQKLEAEIANSVETTSRAWGLHVEAIKLEDIDVPEDLKKMMSRQASSEREKRATIIKADGDRQAAAALAEAAATMAASPGAMQLRTLQTVDGLGPTSSNTVVLALPIEVIELMRSVIAKSTQTSK
jgi:regulator of protease activity HflC (stomatin/prohibitin superfamily)